MLSLDEISTRLEVIQQKINAMQGNTKIYSQSRKLMDKQARFEHRRRNADIDIKNDYRKALELVKSQNTESLSALHQQAADLRAELMNLQYWVEAIEQTNEVDAEDCKDHIYACLISLTENWPLNKKEDDHLLCPITNRVIQKNPILLSNGCYYSKVGLMQFLTNRDYFPRQLPGSTHPVSAIDVEEAYSGLSVAEKTSSQAFKTGYVAGAIPGLGLIALSGIFLIASIVFPPAAALVAPVFFAGIAATFGLSLICGTVFAMLGWVGGAIKDANSIPAVLAPASEKSSSSKIYEAMDIIPGDSQVEKTQQEKAESAPLLPSNVYPPVDLAPVYVSQNKI